MSWLSVVIFAILRKGRCPIFWYYSLLNIIHCIQKRKLSKIRGLLDFEL